MKLCKLYSNFSDRFHNIEFKDGFNVVIANITDKTKINKDTHNLGKTLLASLIDFMLLKKITKDKYFLTGGGFEEQTFFLEIELNKGGYIVVGRGTDNPTKVSFKKNPVKLNTFLTSIQWDEEDVPLEKAVKILNNYLSFDVVEDWNYRKSINYFVRTQKDFLDVFKLDKFKAGRDKDWKPFMFALLGFDGTLILKKYELEEKISKYKQQLITLEQEASIKAEDRDKCQGLLDIRQEEKNRIAADADKFNFYENDKSINEDLVKNIDNNIQTLNTQRYTTQYKIGKIEKSLSVQQSKIDIENLKRLYRDVNLYFPDKLVNDFSNLMEFNRLLINERNTILKENLIELKTELKSLNCKLWEMEQEKQDKLSFLTEKDSYQKFKKIQMKLSQTEAEIITLQNRLKSIDSSIEINSKKRDSEDEVKYIVTEIRNEIGKQSHRKIRRVFNNIISQILSATAIISVHQNKVGNVEFQDEIQNPENLVTTSEASGTTYKKLLCMAFDISLLICYKDSSFYRFAYHDGALEAVDDRKKINFLSVVRDMCSRYNLQYIISLIDSDLPKDNNNFVIDFPAEEVCLSLHDRDNDGKLFKRSF